MKLNGYWIRWVIKMNEISKLVLTNILHQIMAISGRDSDVYYTMNKSTINILRDTINNYYLYMESLRKYEKWRQLWRP
jgi:hypothetical protein